MRRYFKMAAPIAALIIAVLFLRVARAEAQQEAPPPPALVRQSLDAAWWTGPMLAPSAATLPRGHFLIEPYLYDVIATHSNGFGSLTYVNYGLADRVTVGLIPTAGFNKVSNGPSSAPRRFGRSYFANSVPAHEVS